MAWIESHQSMAAHPKTKAAARALRISRATVIGHLHMLWWWALDYAPDGDLSGYNAMDLADAADWEGDPEAFVRALSDCGREGRPGYLEIVEDGRFAIHDWMEYAGKLVEQREANAQRMREKRAAHVQRTCSARTGATVPTVPTNQPTIPTNQEERTAHADAPVKVKQIARAKTPGLSHAPIHDAFDAAGRDRPLIESKKERDAAQFILKHFPDHISAIPECFDDVAAGHYGGPYERRKLSLHLLANDNFLQNYLRWKQNGKPAESAQPRASPNSRPSSQVYDPPRSEVPEWTLPSSAKTTTSP